MRVLECRPVGKWRERGSTKDPSSLLRKRSPEAPDQDEGYTVGDVRKRQGKSGEIGGALK